MTTAAILGAALAAALAYLGGFAAAAFARRTGVIDEPGGRKGHTAPTPLLGGGALAAAWLLVVGAGGTAATGVLLGAIAAWALGTFDDLKPKGLGAGWKLAGQLGVAAVWLAASGYHGAAALGGAACVLFAMNGFNLLDNTDGLCCIAALPPALCLTAVAGGEDTGWAFAAAALAGGLLGYLPHSWPRARVFLGDGGSHLIGFVLGALAFEAALASPSAPGARVLALPALFALALADTATVTVNRLRRGAPPWVGDRTHLSHRLHRAGFAEPAALLVLGAVAAAGALLAALLLRG
ncbi:MAG: undecaprenyl/decaprenyl-phosphate alpha-N-acetylglucosaminyl 1-phosphate transferase [Planctomycetes bacterium]|nr:undecaprenyl/decaprenyl-phosphate alpha-N-acetylglucosaminyl 1-phosphate transferase [Planctomycetota bacterium]